MKRKLQKVTVAAVVAALFAAGAAGVVLAGAGDTNTNSGAAPKLEDLLPDTVIAKGKGLEVKRNQFERAVIDAKANAQATGRQIAASQIPRLEIETLDYLILVQLLNNKATAEDKAKGKETGDKTFDAITKKGMLNEKMLERQLKAVNVTMEDFRKNLNERATAQVVLKSKVKITDEQVKKFYDDNPADMQQPETVRASHILLLSVDPDTLTPLPDDQVKAKRQQLEEIRKRATTGEDFAKLAKEFSQDTGTKDDGGQLKFARRQMDPTFEAAAFALKTNEVSDIVTTRYGMHIIKLAEIVPEHKAALSEVKTNISDYLEGIEVNKLVPTYYKELKKEANVQILDERLKALEESVQR